MSRLLSSQRSRKQTSALNEQEKADQNMLRRMEAYPLAQQRRLNPQDPTAHPAKLFRDHDDPHLPHAYGPDANGGTALPASPRRLYESSSGGAMRPYARSGERASAGPSGLPPQGNTSHARPAIFAPDHYASSVPRGAGAGGGNPAHYKRPALEIMEYTEGRPVTRRALPTDTDEIEPATRSPRALRTRPASARASASVNRPRASAPPPATANYSSSSSSSSMRPSSAHPFSSSFSSSSGGVLSGGGGGGGGGGDPYGSYGRSSASAAGHQADTLGADGAADAYTKLRHKLFALIVEHRIFREQAILKLLHKAKQINAHLNQCKLDRVLEEVSEPRTFTHNATPLPLRMRVGGRSSVVVRG